MRRGWNQWSDILIEVGVIVVIALVLTRLVIVIVGRLSRRIEAQEGLATDLQRRAQTLASVTRSGLLALVWTVAAISALGTAGISVGPILAAAGIVGIALGFGAQNVIKDLLGGFFILLENQYDVGDVVTVQAVTGTVEAVNLRTTVLRSEDGARHVVPNGDIRLSTNVTRAYSRYLFTLTIPAGQDAEATIAVVRRTAERMRMDEPYRRLITRPLRVLGVDDFAAGQTTVSMYIETMPGEQWQVGRELRARIVRDLAAEGLTLG